MVSRMFPPSFGKRVENYFDADYKIHLVDLITILMPSDLLKLDFQTNNSNSIGFSNGVKIFI